MQKYKFKYEDMKFSKDGQLDELIALDRYAVSAFNDYKKNDTVVAIVDKEMSTKKIGTILKVNEDNTYTILDRFGIEHVVEEQLLQKPLETEPHQLWDRWAKGGASVEKTPALREWFENELRWLFDGYRYSLGGRIQLMLGQEFVTGKRANLTAYNCFVIRSPYTISDSEKQFLDVINVAYYEASIMRRGGGVGLNISTINKVKGSSTTKNDFIFYLDKEHKDYAELLDRKKLGKLNGVKIITDKDEYDNHSQNNRSKPINADDSIDGLFSNIKSMVSLSYDGNKVLINFNDLRERNSIVKGVNGRSSGAVSWMELFILIANLLQQTEIDNVDFAEIFSHITNLIEQGGSRRGALMLICNDDNPQLIKFMERKRKKGYLTGANISVGVSESFMESVLEAKELLKNQENDLKKHHKEALSLWNILIKSAWESAEPGIVWLERYNKESNSWYFHELVATNPCGEQGLPPFGVCNLGHFVLSTFYDKDTNDVNWDDLARAIRIAVRLQDNIIDYTEYFLKENEEVQLSERRVGIGSLGLGTLMIQKKLRYGSDEGNVFIDKLYKFIAKESYKQSMKLAQEKGAFPKYEYEKFIQSGFMKNLLSEFPELHDELMIAGIRNVTLLTQAPTGSTGTYIDNIPMFRELFGGTTTGVEPYYSFEYWRAGRLGHHKQTVELALNYMKENNLSDISELPSYFACAMDLEPIDHIKVQGTIQKYTDSSISKTANCPNEYTIAQTDELYLQSYLLGLKGMTIYRDGSREAQVLATKEEDANLESHLEANLLKQLKVKELEVSNENSAKEDIEDISVIKKVPSRLFGMREKVRYQSGDKMSKAYIQIYVDEHGVPIELWIQPIDANDKDMADALGRMTTQFLRFGATNNNVEQAIKHLKQGKSMFSLPAIVGRLLSDVFYGKIEMPTFNKKEEKIKKKFELAECPECGERAYDKGNCICTACGQSKCN